MLFEIGISSSIPSSIIEVRMGLHITNYLTLPMYLLGDAQL